MQVAFNVLQFKEVSKKQLISYVKKYKLHQNPTTLDKRVLAQLLAKYYISSFFFEKNDFFRSNCPQTENAYSRNFDVRLHSAAIDMYKFVTSS